MNQLSWILYGASAADNLRFYAGIAFLIGGAAAAVTYFISDPGDRKAWDSALSDHSRYPSLHPKPPAGDRPKLTFPFRYLSAGAFWAAILGAGVTVVVPSKDTLYAIAASQVGEQVIASPTAQKAITALNAWLDKQIAPKN